MKKYFLLLIVLVLLILEACGSPDEKTQRIIEPEELISKEEAAALTGLEIVEVEKSEEDRVGLKICVYTTEGDYLESIFLQISIVQKAFMIKEQTQSPEEIFRGTIEFFEDKIEVEGIGDEAYIFTPGLHILTDGYYLTIAAGNTDSLEVQELIKKAGKLAVENLSKIK